jgi:hypothetical protein
VLLTGVAGLTSFGQAAFVGVGAYTAAFLAVNLGVSPWLTLLVGVALAVAAALLLGALTLRMSGHYLPLATIAWGLALNYTMANMEWLGKYDGILGIPPLSLFGVDLGTGRGLHPLVWAIALLAALAAMRLLDSRPGRAIRALKSGSTMAEAMGISTFRYKLTVFVSRPSWRPSRAGCSRTSSAASARRPSASTRASNTCSWRCWAAWAMSGAPSWARPWCGWSKTSCRCCCRSSSAPAATSRPSSSASCWWWC